ncbi:hypothetical protein KKH3_13360 [Pectobacterium actinidiae]|nr:hypothetical protein KKH3_13360 [Pectobacterium actinidiae]
MVITHKFPLCSQGRNFVEKKFKYFLRVLSSQPSSYLGNDFYYHFH